MSQIDPKQIKSSHASVGDVLTKGGAGEAIWQAPAGGGGGLQLGGYNYYDPFPHMLVYNNTTERIDQYSYVSALGPAYTGSPTYLLGQFDDADQRGWYPVSALPGNTTISLVEDFLILPSNKQWAFLLGETTGTGSITRLTSEFYPGYGHLQIIAGTGLARIATDLNIVNFSSGVLSSKMLSIEIIPSGLQLPPLPTGQFEFGLFDNYSNQPIYGFIIKQNAGVDTLHYRYYNGSSYTEIATDYTTDNWSSGINFLKINVSNTLLQFMVDEDNYDVTGLDLSTHSFGLGIAMQVKANYGGFLLDRLTIETNFGI